jgi:hypothetical protein
MKLQKTKILFTLVFRHPFRLLLYHTKLGLFFLLKIMFIVF